jgi:hypothetical protein
MGDKYEQTPRKSIHASFTCYNGTFDCAHNDQRPHLLIFLLGEKESAIATLNGNETCEESESFYKMSIPVTCLIRSLPGNKNQLYNESVDRSRY